MAPSSPLGRLAPLAPCLDGNLRLQTTTKIDWATCEPDRGEQHKVRCRK